MPEVPAAEAVVSHKEPRSESWGQPPAEVGDPPAQWVEERPVEYHTRIPRSRRPIVVEDDQTGDEISYSVSSPVHPGGNPSVRLWESRNPCWQLETQFQPGDRSFGPGIYWDGWRGAEVLPHDPCQRTQVNQPWGVQEVIRGLKVSKASGSNSIPNRTLKHLPQRAVSFLAQNFNAILLAHHFCTAWKHARVISILKPGKDPVLPSSYRPISLLDTIGKIVKRYYYLGSYMK